MEPGISQDTLWGQHFSSWQELGGRAARFPDLLLRMESAKMEKVLKVVPLGYAPARLLSFSQGG